MIFIALGFLRPAHNTLFLYLSLKFDLKDEIRLKDTKLIYLIKKAYESNSKASSNFYNYLLFM
jgi:hypothetical protein